MAQANPDDGGGRLQRVLAYMFASMVGITVISFFAIVIGTYTGTSSGGFGSGIWPVVFLIPLIALPLAFILLIVLIIMIARKRVREAAAHAALPQTRAPRRK